MVLFAGKFILGLCSFLTCNHALRLVTAEMLGFKDPNVEVRLGWGCVQYCGLVVDTGLLVS